MFGLFRKATPVIDEATATWLFDLFAWAIQHLDGGIFLRDTRLIEPTPEFFPGRAESVHGMAQLMFERVRHYSGLDHWPMELVPPLGFNPYAAQQWVVPERLRLAPSASGQLVVSGPSLKISYDPQLIDHPEAMIAAFAHTLALYLAAAAPQPPPGGEENRPHAAEVIALFLGFGVMLVNTAFTTQVRSCGSCAAPAQRQSFLSQYDMSYALALFVALKPESERGARRHLKSSLRPYFKQAIRAIRGQRELLEQLTRLAQT